MLQQPTKEKLYALKLQGMIEAIERQEQDEAARELSFLDRLALLIDQQWNWRENQALTRRVKASRLRGAACVEDIDYRAERGLNKSVIRGLAQESPRASGVDSLAHGELGRADRTAHGTVIRTDPGREAASGDGVSILSGNHPAG